MAGTRSKLTVIDIDAPDEDLLKGMIKQYGDTPIILRSGSGNFQLWGRHGGEGRRIRPQADIPVDILGRGDSHANDIPAARSTSACLRAKRPRASGKDAGAIVMNNMPAWKTVQVRPQTIHSPASHCPRSAIRGTGNSIKFRGIGA